MAGPSDLAIATHVGAILARHWIDPNAVEYGSLNGVVYLSGELRLNPAVPLKFAIDAADDLAAAIERDIRALDAVKDVRTEFEIPEGEASG